EDPGSCKEGSRRTVSSARRRVVTGPGPYALLTLVALMGADDRKLHGRMVTLSRVSCQCGGDRLIQSCHSYRSARQMSNRYGPASAASIWLSLAQIHEFCVCPWQALHVPGR